MRISDWSSDVCSSDLGRSERIRNKAFGGKVGAAEVATRHALPADMQFAYDSRRYRFTAGVQDVDAGVGDRAPDRDRCRARRHVVDAMGAGEGGAFGRPIAVVQRHPWRRSTHARSEEHTSELQSPMRISYA